MRPRTSGSPALTRLFALLVAVILLPAALHAQRPSGASSGATGGRPEGIVSGRVVDAEEGGPIGYAEVILRAARDDAIVTGGITDEEGRFRVTGVRPGLYHLEVRIIGYAARTIEDVAIRPDRPVVDLGTIALDASLLFLEGDEITADKPALEYRIDRKVLHVDRQPTAPSGTAVDVLENVPSVTVDIEGNVQLRGSSSFSVFIDGRPSLLEPGDALRQLPAGAIETIEIITNPSARYDPDGTSGIVNVRMKRSGAKGRSGLVNANAGLDDKYGGDLLLNYRDDSTLATLGGDYNRRSYPGSRRQENETTLSDTTSFLRSSGASGRRRTAYGVRAEIEVSPRSIGRLALGGRLGGRRYDGDSALDYDEWNDPGGAHSLYRSRSDSERSGVFYSAHGQYRRPFAREGHELTAQVTLDHRDTDEETTDELFDLAGGLTDGRRSTESGPSDRLRAKVDYTRPFGTGWRLEAGGQARFGSSGDVTALLEYDPGRGEYVADADADHTTDYERDIHALYGILAGERGPFGAQAGVRGEYTDRLVTLRDSGEHFAIDRWDLFPSAHASWRFGGGRQAMASYSRRIERPRSWYLEPFETWTDAFNVRRGNPGLDPERIDSYELGFQTDLGPHFFSAEAYYRVTHEKIERVRSAYSETVTLRTLENVGRDRSLGMEVSLDVDLFPWWDLRLSGNIYDFQVEGALFGESFDRQSFNWNGRLQHELRLGAATRVQMIQSYNSPTVWSQGRFEGFFRSNVTVRRDLFERVMTASLQVSDIFDTARHESTSSGRGFSSFDLFDRRAPQVVLTLTYNFNDYRPERRRERGGGEGGEDDEF